MELQLPKGVRDFPPEEAIARDALLTKLKRVFERYGYNPLETPTFERMDVLAAKYAGGDEILKETFRFRDQGKRALGLRYDLTVPFARFVGMNPQLKLPFKRYAIGRVFRDGPLKLGRYREFYQCDADIVGTKSVLADAECIRLALAGFAELGLNVTIAVNNRKLLEALLAKGGVAKAQAVDAMLTLDKVKKIPLADLKKELAEKTIAAASVDFIITVSTEERSNKERLAAIKEYLGGEPEGYQEVAALLTYLDGVANVRFDPSLARGLAYYTGTVFEGFVQGSAITSSVCGGGRYDTLIGGLLGHPDAYPAVGFSFGIEPIMDVLKEQGVTQRKSAVQAYVIPIKTLTECAAIVEQLRRAGINVDMDLAGKSISKNLDYANSYAIPYVIIAGQQELSQGKVKLKEMGSGKEELLTVEEAIVRLKA